MNATWLEDEFHPRVDEAVRGASPHQREIRPAHPEWFRAGDVVRIGKDRLVGTGKFYFGTEIMRALNESVLVAAVEDGLLVTHRGYGANPAQRVRRGDVLTIIGNSA
jgi:hypothetical protein